MGENSLNNKEHIENIFETKQKRRKDLAALSIEEKVRILVQLQRIALPIYLARGLEKRAWELL